MDGPKLIGPCTQVGSGGCKPSVRQVAVALGKGGQAAGTVLQHADICHDI